MINIKDIVANDLCIGCGACATQNNQIKIEANNKGQLVANLDALSRDESESISDVCPWSNKSDNEDTISKKLFSSNNIHDHKIGYYSKIFRGFVNDKNIRLKSSSGGIIRWLLMKLKEENYIDGIIQVKAYERKSKDNENKKLYSYEVFNNIEDISKASRSSYYPVEFSQVIKEIKEDNKTYAITGVPCFIKAIRLLQKKDPVIESKIKFTISLICGHLKSTFYADFLSKQLNIQPENISSIDFREKLENAKANEKGLKIKEVSGDIQKIKVKELFGSDYNLGFFQYKACDFCDDIIGETADISVGDAWLPECIDEPLGESIVVVRDPQLKKLIEESVNKKLITCTELKPDRVVESQSGGYRQRREGLIVRLNNEINEDTPIKHLSKRVDLSLINKISKKRINIYNKRVELRIKSSEFYNAHKNEKSPKNIISKLSPIVDEYYSLYKESLIIRALKKTERELRKIYVKYS
tara:strand:- start:14971 stop:16380 length:1410 start_codon:yes stop_codon:yes gene_type:complete